MNNDTVMYIAVAAAVLAVIALIMICQVRSSLNQSAAPAAAAKKAAPAGGSRAPLSLMYFMRGPLIRVFL